MPKTMGPLAMFPWLIITGLLAILVAGFSLPHVRTQACAVWNGFFKSR